MKPTALFFVKENKAEKESTLRLITLLIGKARTTKREAWSELKLKNIFFS